jgi:hypothetical protein
MYPTTVKKEDCMALQEAARATPFGKTCDRCFGPLVSFVAKVDGRRICEDCDVRERANG